MKVGSLLLTSAMAIALTACSNNQSENSRNRIATETTVETEAGAQTTRFELDYESFTLDNGLEVILQRDTSDPIVAVSTVIHAGSAREKPGRTGFAHFFEHMAFNDSENVPRGWNRGQIPKWGGTRNGGTWSDGTIYYEVVPKDAFDKILWIDSDRLGYMINTVTEAALEREKQVVKNEKRQRVDNAPYGYTNEVIRNALYPEGHPYNWTVIGSLPDLQAATLDDVREFYDLWYGPNNATLAIIGDIDIEETKEKVKLWFGEIPRGRDIPDPEPQPVSLEETKNLWFEDNFAKLPELRMTFPTPEAKHEDTVALNVLGSLLGGSKTSPLHIEIVETEKLAPSVSAYNSQSELTSTFTIRVRANADTDLDAVRASVETALAKFAEEGVNETDLERVRAEQETALYSGLSTVLGKANSFTRYNELYGDPAYAVRNAAAIRMVTAEQVKAVFDRYIDDQPHILTSFVPKGQAELAVEGAERASVWIEEVTDGNANEEVSAGDVAEFEKTQTVHDRSEPAFGELPLLNMPGIWTRTLANGVDVYGIEQDEVPLVQFDLTLPGGAWTESPEQNGRMALLADLMSEGTATKTAAELQQAIGLLGSTINVSADAYALTIGATTLPRNVEATVALIEEMLTQPRWEDETFERVKSARLTSLKGREANPNAIAALAFDRLIYGDDHPLGRPTGGSEQSIDQLTLDDLKTAHTAALSAQGRLHLVGDIAPAIAEDVLTPIAEALSPADQSRPDYSIPEQDNAGKVYFIDVPDSKQSVLRIGKLVPASGHPDFNKIDFTNDKLGGGIAGDLAQVLRIEKGYTYGAYSFVPRSIVQRPFTIGTSVRANATQPSLEVIRSMVQTHGSTFDEQAVEATQQKIVKTAARAFESFGAKLGTLSEMSFLNLLPRYVEEEQAELLAMTAEDFQRIAADYLDESEMIYVVVGDKATQFDPVSEFAEAADKGEVVELDIYGTPIE